MESPDGFTGPVNLGTPREFTIRELAQQIIALTGSASIVVTLPLPEDDPLQRKPDIGLARAVLGWEPQVPLEQGLERTIAYFKGVVEEAGLVEAIQPPPTTRSPA